MRKICCTLRTEAQPEYVSHVLCRTNDRWWRFETETLPTGETIRHTIRAPGYKHIWDCAGCAVKQRQVAAAA